MRYRNEQLCWNCKHACGDCPWSRAYNKQPVKGWKAKPTLINNQGVLMKSFQIYECPLFEKDTDDLFVEDNNGNVYYFKDFLSMPDLTDAQSERIRLCIELGVKKAPEKLHIRIKQMQETIYYVYRKYKARVYENQI